MTRHLDALDQMKKTLAQQVNLSVEDWEKIGHDLKVMEVPEKYLLQAAGKKVTHHYFVVSGLVRMYYPTAEGKELNKAFYGENYIVGNLSAPLLDEPSRFAVETLEPCVLVELPLMKVQKLSDLSPGWGRLLLRSYQMMMIRNERREAELLTMTAKQRFLQFVRNFPDYLTRIPQYHIASYLGITPVALSKFKKQWLEESDKLH